MDNIALFLFFSNMCGSREEYFLYVLPFASLAPSINLLGWYGHKFYINIIFLFPRDASI